MRDLHAVVCLSGGMDSAVTLAEAARVGKVAALHMTYGQRTAPRERRAFDQLCRHYGVTQTLVVEQPALSTMGGSALTDLSIDVPMDQSTSGVPVTYVPFRNGQILALACAWAEVLGARAVYLGAMEEDSSGYPDCRQVFFEAFAAAVDAGTKPQTRIELVTPLLHLGKGQVVKRGLELDVPFELTWSCYVGDERACGRCESCQLRLRGFAVAAAEDPVPYDR